MWGNDFPHPEGTWPYTREFLKERFHDIPVDETERILGLNQVDFYGFDVDRLQPDRRPHRSDARRPRPDGDDAGARVGAVQEGGTAVAHRRGSRCLAHRQRDGRGQVTT